jgi:type II secretory pathway pseudopilin PulG
MMMRRQREAGFSAVELMISFAIAGIVLGVSFVVTATTAQNTDVVVSVSQLRLEAERAVNRIIKEVLQASVGTLTPQPTPPLGSDSLRFRRVVDVVDGNIQWSNDTAFELQPDPNDPQDGIDNDGDGLVDECQVVLRTDIGLPSETTTLIVDKVSSLAPGELMNGADDNGNGLVDERGLSFSLDGDVLTIRLNRSGTTGGQVINANVQTSISLRN